MEILLNWIGIGSGALLAIAVTVAWWEHRKRQALKRRTLAAAQIALLGDESMPAPDAAHDQPQRRQALDSAMQRMAKAGAALSPALTPNPAAAAATAAHPSPEPSRPATNPGDAAAAPSAPWADTVPMVQASGIPIRQLPDIHWDGGTEDEPSRPMDLQPH